jgi:hypothetical protein
MGRFVAVLQKPSETRYADPQDHMFLNLVNRNFELDPAAGQIKMFSTPYHPQMEVQQ